MGEMIPQSLRFESERIEGVRLTACGGSHSWSAPCAVIDAPLGFSDEDWSHSGALDTVMSWALSGSDVLCEGGRYRGRFVGLNGGNVTPQPLSAPNLHSAKGPIRFAHEVGLSPAQFVRMFRRATGCSPHAYVLARRCERGRS